MSRFTRNRKKARMLRPDYKPSQMPSKEELHKIRVAYIEHKEKSKPGRNNPEYWNTLVAEPDPEFDKRYQEQVEAEKRFKEWKATHQYPNFIPKDWRDCYQMPLHLDEYSLGYFWTTDDKMAASTLDIDYATEEDFKKSREWWRKIVAVINGEAEPEWPACCNVSPKDPCAILYQDKFAFLVRGWGHLTGSGWALKLPPELASQMQDQFVQYIIDKLNGVK